MVMKKIIFLLIGVLLFFPINARADKVHGLTCNDNGICNVVIHTSKIAGNNSSGISWQQACLDNGNCSSTSLSDSYITTSESNQVSSGDVIEITSTVNIESGGGTATSINEQVDAIITDYKSRLQRLLEYYGKTVN
jgi:hypothetical protein